MSEVKPYRVLVTGSRDWDRPSVIQRRLNRLHDTHGRCVLVSGACPTGADRMAAGRCTSPVPAIRSSARVAPAPRHSGPPGPT